MRLIQVALRATDLDRVEGFYRRLLGQSPTGRFDPPGLLFFDVGGTRLLLEAGAPASMLYLGVEDVRALVEDLRPTVEIHTEPHLVFTHPDDRLGPAGTEEWQAFIVDSEGNLVGLVTQYPTS